MGLNTLSPQFHGGWPLVAVSHPFESKCRDHGRAAGREGPAGVNTRNSLYNLGHQYKQVSASAAYKSVFYIFKYLAYVKLLGALV